MFSYPNILKNPFDSQYNLIDLEIYSLKEADGLIEIKKYPYALFALWNACIINLQRRLEIFGIQNFLKLIKDKEKFDENSHNLKERWLAVNEFSILDYAKTLNIINKVTHSLLVTLFWMKSNANEEKEELDEFEVLSMFYLIEKNLFLKPFKEDMRGKDPHKTNTKVKFRRKDDIKADETAIPTTYHNLLMKSGVKVFEEQNNSTSTNDNKHLIDEYG